MKITFTYNGFHGRHQITVIPQSVRILADGTRRVALSPSAAKRIRKTVCGVSSCQCCEGVAESQDEIIYIPANGEVRGHYPQN